MLEALWVVIKVAVVAAVSVAILNWVLRKTGFGTTVSDLLSLGIVAARKWIGW